jgi:cytoskeleton protein RodZ
MPSIGQTLREARTKAGLELEFISSKTRIPVQKLRAIEEDDLGQITSAFFYKSFVRQFCEQIGMPYSRLADAVQQASIFYPEPLRPEQLGTVVQRSIVTPRERTFNPKTLAAVASFAVVLTGCSLLYPILQGKMSDIPEVLEHARQTIEAYLPGHSTTQTSPKAQPGTSVVARGSHPVSNDSGIRVELSAIEPSWLSMVADGHQTFNGILEPEQSKVLQCRDSGRVRTGNAGGVRFAFNGKPVGVVGPRGKVRIIVFTKDNYEVLEPSPVASLSNVPRFFTAVVEPMIVLP